MRSRALLIDGGLAVVLAASVLILAPGLGAVAAIVLLFAVVCALSLGVSVMARRLARGRSRDGARRRVVVPRSRRPG